jgi:SSS family transporter
LFTRYEKKLTMFEPRLLVSIAVVAWLSLGLNSTRAAESPGRASYLHWSNLTNLPPTGHQSEALGVAGPVAGAHNGAMIIAGGANFDTPYWDNDKVWHDDIFVWVAGDDGSGKWMHAGKLDHPLAYSAVVSTAMGVLAMGGDHDSIVYDEVLLLRWDEKNQKVITEYLPPLPAPCTNGDATVIGSVVYLAGGTSTSDQSTAMTNLWRLDLQHHGTKELRWEVLPGWPGPPRAYNITQTQHNGYSDCIYVISGRREDTSGSAWDVLTDVYEFDPEKYAAGKETPWVRKADIPAARMAGTSVPVGQSHIFVISGADGSLYQLTDSLRDHHPGFPKSTLAYHTLTDTWYEAGDVPANPVTTHAFRWENGFAVACGEVRPRVRTPDVWKVTPVSTAKTFGWINGSAVVLYLLALVGMGVFFSFRNKSTEDFFRGGQRIPWWAAGCSIFATMLSSLTFMSIPAKTYSTDWLYFFLNMTVIALAPFIIRYILPFFRRIDATSAYQYLEMRFNLAARLFGSASYILFQMGRMAIVMYLPSLALATVTPISIEMCIAIMGILSILYCTLGGLEAVIWTDTLQTFVLLGGALLSLLLVILSKDIGANEFFSIALENDKFRLVDWDLGYTGTALWVIILGGIGQTLIPYSSDQGVVQRYMSVASEKKAARSIWTNAVLTTFATFLFFGVGTALYVFYKRNPSMLDPTFQTDAIFPLFIARQLPVGVAGIVIAGIFAAAQSTISTSMNSIATAFTTDFVRRFNLLPSEKRYLNLARTITVLAGLGGTGFALVIAYADVKSLWDSFISILGLLGGAMCGLFVLGIFTKRAHGPGALVGAIAGVAFLLLVQHYTAVSFLLYGSIGITATFAFGYLSSVLIRTTEKDVTGLTIYSVRKSH